MISLINKRFRECFKKLPKETQLLAQKNYKLWKNNPFHLSLQFKQVAPEIYSVRIGASYRALGIKIEDKIVWFWIGHHSDYDKILVKINKN
ncbi:hypothetical protein IT568_04090 [bacterium]|nr:hypothetical protein [bacterium]